MTDTTLAEHIAKAILELMQSIPNPDKDDLTVCIHRALEEAPKAEEPEVTVDLSGSAPRETLEEH